MEPQPGPVGLTGVSGPRKEERGQASSIHGLGLGGSPRNRKAEHGTRKPSKSYRRTQTATPLTLVVATVY